MDCQVVHQCFSRGRSRACQRKLGTKASGHKLKRIAATALTRWDWEQVGAHQFSPKRRPHWGKFA
jgi:hypothetical protein